MKAGADPFLPPHDARPARLSHFIARLRAARLGIPTTVLCLAIFLTPTAALMAETPEEAWKELLRGRPEKALELAVAGTEEQPRNELWHRVHIQALLDLGRYPEAENVSSNALERVPRSILVRWMAGQAYSANGTPGRGRELITEIPTLFSRNPRLYRDPLDFVTFGRALLAIGMDPKEVLDRVYAAARKADPALRDVYLACGELALDKGDFAMAGREFDAGLKQHPQDPDLHYGRARAFAESDRKEMGASLEAALKANPRHVPSILLLAEHHIDGEDYDDALRALADALKANPHHPDAWALKAVIAHLRSDEPGETEARQAALRFWPENPRVPHLIGRMLSQKYRFAEGAALQREALVWDPSCVPCKAQLASDLLRLGEDAEGWDLVQQVHTADGYDVTAYNLATLRDTMAEFTTLTNAHFVVRMHANEAAIYGARVLDVLERARAQLVPKYGATLQEPTTVEIFPNPNDFGVRTFGMPDNPGYLGVCFGRVITANSPASSRGKSVNWEAVLWHEFCHVVTLQLTRNKMPRWLSEGISTYEERLANPSWGEQLNPQYREMILGEDLTPISRLSAAFLTPKSGLHLQFAYYQSSLVVQFLIDRFGIEKLRAVLRDLAEGVFINTALEQHTTAMDTLEKDFAAFARATADALGPDIAWDRPKPDRGRVLPELSALLPTGKTNFWALSEQARTLVQEQRWDEAQPILESLIRHYPGQSGSESAHALLALVHRNRGDTEAEHRVLERWATLDDSARDAYARLMEIGIQAGAWDLVVTNAQRYLAVDPLVPLPYRHLTVALEGQARIPEAIATYRTLLRLDPPNPADVHFRLARLLHPTAPAEARRHLLMALEDAPRNRAALGLLRELGPAGPPTDPPLP